MSVRENVNETPTVRIYVLETLVETNNCFALHNVYPRRFNKIATEKRT